MSNQATLQSISGRRKNVKKDIPTFTAAPVKVAFCVMAVSSAFVWAGLFGWLDVPQVGLNAVSMCALGFVVGWWVKDMRIGGGEK